MTTHTLSSNTISYNWYLTIKCHGKECTILKHWRQHHCANNHPKTSGTFDLIEDELPVKVRAYYYGRSHTFKVRNPDWLKTQGKELTP